MNTIAKEAELAREVRIVATANTPLDGTVVARAIGIVDRLANQYLRLRKNSKGESPVRGTGKVVLNTLELRLTIPLDTRYKQENESAFNQAWANAFMDEFGVYVGGYASLEEEAIKNQIVIETDKSVEELQRLLGGFGTILN